MDEATVSSKPVAGKWPNWLSRTLAICAVCVAIIAGCLWWQEHRVRPYRELRAALAEIQLAIERFATDTEGAYPPTIEAAYAHSHAELPDNPFGPGKVKLLKPGDAWEPGGIVYVGMGPIIAVGKQIADQDPIVPTEIDQYVLVAYSPRKSPARAKLMAEAKQEREQAMKRMSAGDNNVSIPVYADGIGWDHVAMMRTAGDYYVPND